MTDRIDIDVTVNRSRSGRALASVKKQIKEIRQESERLGSSLSIGNRRQTRGSGFEEDIVRAERRIQRLRNAQTTLSGVNRRSGFFSGGFGGGRGGSGRGSIFSNGLAGSGLTAAGALTGLTGNFAFLGAGFAAMSGGGFGAGLVAATTALGSLIRTSASYENTILSLKGQSDKLSGAIQAQVEAFTNSVQRMNNASAIIALGGARTNGVTGVGIAARTIAGTDAQNVTNLMLDFGEGLTGILQPLGDAITNLRKFSRVLDHTASLQEDVARFQQKRLQPIRERFSELGFDINLDRENNLLDLSRRGDVTSSNRIRGQVNRRFAFRQEQRRVAGLVSSGSLDINTGATFLAQQRERILGDGFQSGFVGLEDLNRRITASSAGMSGKEPTKEDIREQTMELVKASKDIATEIKSLKEEIEAGVLGTEEGIRVRR